MDYTIVPRNHVRILPIKVSADMVQSLDLLRSLKKHDFSLSTVAEKVMHEWFESSRNSFEREFGFYEEIARREGYLPAEINCEAKRTIDSIDEIHGNLAIKLSGWCRFCIEMLPVTEYAFEGEKGQRINPSYLKSIEQVVEQALKQRVPVEILKARNLESNQ